MYVKIRANLDRLMREADRIDLKLPLDPKKLSALLKSGRKEGDQVRGTIVALMALDNGTVNIVCSLPAITYYSLCSRFFLV